MAWQEEIIKRITWLVVAVAFFYLLIKTPDIYFTAKPEIIEWVSLIRDCKCPKPTTPPTKETK